MTSDCSLKYTAEAMHVHINTLHYRLKRIQDLTTLDPKRMQDAMLFYLAFMLLDDDPKNEANSPIFCRIVHRHEAILFYTERNDTSHQ